MAKNKITEAQWAEARLLFSKGARMVDIADKSGIALRTIQQNKQVHPDLWLKDAGLSLQHKDLMELDKNSVPGLAEDLKYSMKALTKQINKIVTDPNVSMEELRKAKEIATIIKTTSAALKDLNMTELEVKNKGIKKREVNIRAESHKIDWNKLYLDSSKVEDSEKFIETIVDAEYSIKED